MKKFLIIFILFVINFIQTVYADNTATLDKKQIVSIENSFNQYIKKEKHFIINAEQILEQHGYPLKYKKDKNDIKINLLDGDFVIIKNGVPYFAEYHTDGSIMGMLRVRVIKSDNKALFSFYEYRTGYNIQVGMGLKHVVFITPSENNKFKQYIFNNKGTLLCYQDDKSTYLAPDSKDMLINLSAKETKKYTKHIKKVFKKYKDNDSKLPVSIQYIQAYIRSTVEVPVFVVMFTYCLIALSFQ